MVPARFRKPGLNNWIHSMAKDRRTHRKLTQDEVKDLLNSKQLATLQESQCFGWRLKFIRRPLFLNPVPVLYNTRFGYIGILEPDGQINVKPELEVRPGVSIQGKQPPTAAARTEKRAGMEPIPDNFEELLDQTQLDTLRKIEKFGWQLYFIRRPSSGAAVPVIISPKGDHIASLEQDGRINLMSNSAIRKEAPAEQTESAPPVSASTSKQAG
jgi:hypothetical protein